MSPGVLTWRHEFAGDVPVNEQIDRVLERLKAGDFTVFAPGPEGLAAFRAFWVAAVGSAARLGTTPPTAFRGESTEPTEIQIKMNGATDDGRREWQNGLSAGLVALAVGTSRKIGALPVPAPGEKQTISTVGGNEATASTEAGFAWIPAIVAGAVVLVAGIIAGACSYSNALDAELQLKEIEADQKRQLVAQAIAASSEVVNGHLDREEEKGASFPWSEGEMATLKTLQDAITAAVKWEPVLSPVPDVRTVTQKTGEAIAEVGKGVASATETAGWGFAAALVAAAVLLATSD